MLCNAEAALAANHPIPHGRGLRPLCLANCESLVFCSPRSLARGRFPRVAQTIPGGSPARTRTVPSERSRARPPRVTRTIPRYKRCKCPAARHCKGIPRAVGAWRESRVCTPLSEIVRPFTANEPRAHRSDAHLAAAKAFLSSSRNFASPTSVSGFLMSWRMTLIGTVAQCEPMSAAWTSALSMKNFHEILSSGARLLRG